MATEERKHYYTGYPDDYVEQRVYDVMLAFDLLVDDQQRSPVEREQADQAALLRDAFSNRTNEWTEGAQIVKAVFSKEEPPEEYAWYRYLAATLCVANEIDYVPSDYLTYIYYVDVRKARKFFPKNIGLILPRSFLDHFFVLPSWMIAVPAKYLRLMVEIDGSYLDDATRALSMPIPESIFLSDEGLLPDPDVAIVEDEYDGCGANRVIYDPDMEPTAGGWRIPSQVVQVCPGQPLHIPFETTVSENVPKGYVPPTPRDGTWTMEPENAVLWAVSKDEVILVPHNLDTQERAGRASLTFDLEDESRTVEILLEGFLSPMPPSLELSSGNEYTERFAVLLSPFEAGDEAEMEFNYPGGYEVTVSPGVDADDVSNQVLDYLPDTGCEYCTVEVKALLDDQRRPLARDGFVLHLHFRNVETTVPVSLNTSFGRAAAAREAVRGAGAAAAMTAVAAATAAGSAAPKADGEPKSDGMKQGVKSQAADAAKEKAKKVADEAADKAIDKGIDVALDAAGAATGPVGTVAAQALKAAKNNPEINAKLKGGLKGGLKNAVTGKDDSDKTPEQQSKDKAKKTAKKVARRGFLALALNPITLGIMFLLTPLIIIALVIAIAFGSSSAPDVIGGLSTTFTPNAMIDVLGHPEEEEKEEKGTAFDGEWVYYDQSNPNWDTTGDACYNWTAGCGVTSVAMVWSSYAKDTTYTPSYITQNCGAGLYFETGSMIVPGCWEYVNEHPEIFHLRASEGTAGSDGWLENWDRVKEVCKNGGCVILAGGYTFSSTEAHYVVCTKVEDGIVTLKDPWGGYERTMTEGEVTSGQYSTNITQCIWFEKI